MVIVLLVYVGWDAHVLTIGAWVLILSGDAAAVRMEIQSERRSRAGALVPP